MRPHCLLSPSLVLLPLVAAAADRQGLITGDWQPIKKMSDPNVKEIAEFAVSEYNKPERLVFVNVEGGELVVEDGIKYLLVISAKNETVADPAATSAVGYYHAFVSEKFWEHFTQLLFFCIN
ncbi:unnamed protein product [Malus baccata var. baccata]